MGQEYTLCCVSRRGNKVAHSVSMRVNRPQKGTKCTPTKGTPKY